MEPGQAVWLYNNLIERRLGVIEETEVVTPTEFAFTVCGAGCPLSLSLSPYADKEAVQKVIDFLQTWTKALEEYKDSRIV